MSSCKLSLRLYFMARPSREHHKRQVLLWVDTVEEVVHADRHTCREAGAETGQAQRVVAVNERAVEAQLALNARRVKRCR